MSTRYFSNVLEQFARLRSIRALSPRYAKKRRRPNILRCLDGLHLEPDATTLPRQGRADVLAVLPVHPQITLLNNSSEKRH